MYVQVHAHTNVILKESYIIYKFYAIIQQFLNVCIIIEILHVHVILK